MNHPVIASRNADLRYRQLLESAQAYRLAKTVSGKDQTWLHTIMLRLFPISAQQPEMRSDLPSLSESAS